ncbi:MAG: histidine phosphatase family protein [Propionibacteriaceae bacterium]|jgi:broad specificity phosphatase PhoE|nr:histidine phosphatase family protein [Propionibacteriaceae bacterium]
MSGPAAVVHLLRHGEVDNPSHVLYGRLPGYHLSERGHAMAALAAAYFHDVPLTHLRCSPLERTRETLAPIAADRPDLPVAFDERLVEAANVFEGQVFGPRHEALRRPAAWKHLLNPLRPSWGEPYADIVVRMQAAVRDAAEAAGPGGQALVVSHQLPIWMARCAAEGRRLAHDPRRRQCALASVTTLTVADGVVIKVDYAEPAAGLA